ncbi:MAG TPA: glycosyltransferase [Pyrinomonadaceae bacterium]|jgi:GT2 family glycosyltransferase|nr:glycosyltransferase [Pyrinomonadaceae bacterium]
MKSGISAIVTAYERIDQTLATLKIIQSCVPAPDEILVHVDANQTACENAIRNAFPEIQILRSEARIGPGGGRNKLVSVATCEFIASFDDDSYPIDSEYFARALKIFEKFPEASLICAALYHAGETIGLDTRSAHWTADFSGGACIFRRQAFLDAGGYVPLPVAYGMEEVDLAIRLHSRGGRILTTPWLRVFHNTDLKRHGDPKVTAGSIANLALLAYLRYPVSLWGIGVGQCANRLLWLLRHGRRRGILKGVTMIPAHLQANRRYRLPVSKSAVRSYLALRRAPIAAEL